MACPHCHGRSMKPALFSVALIFAFTAGWPATCRLQSLPQSQETGEDWRTLAVNRSELGPASILDAGVQSQPGFTRQLLQAEWRGGDPIDLYVIRPEGAVKPPVVIFLYSWPDDTDRFRSDAWCQNITKHGFAAVGFVSALTGQRYHNRSWKETFVDELPEALGKTVHDVQLLLDYLDTRGDLDAKRAGIFGQGSGGTIALLAASVEPRLKATDVIDPWGDWPDWFRQSPLIPEPERTRFLHPAFLKSISAYDPVLVLPSLAGGAVRLQQTTLNPSTPPLAGGRIRGALPPSLSYTVYSSEEDYRARAMKDGAILNWLEGRLSHAVVAAKD